MLGFLNNAMTTATQRFLAFEIGRKDHIKLRNVFSMSVNIHIVIAIVIVLLAETGEYSSHKHRISVVAPITQSARLNLTASQTYQR
jgi:hypothetical protein